MKTIYLITWILLVAVSSRVQPLHAAPTHGSALVRSAAPVTPVAPAARQYNLFVLRAADAVEKELPEIQRVAEVVAQRHFEGGEIIMPWNGQSLQQELSGRSGGMMNIGGTSWLKQRTPEQDKKNIAIYGWDRAPRDYELAQMRQLREAGTLILGFGPRDLPELSEHVGLCDAFFDTRTGAGDRVVVLPGGDKAGRANTIVNMLNGWAVIAEVVAALTRRGVMPIMWKSWMYPDGRAWSDKYYGKAQWHDDYKITPIAPGILTRAFLNEIRDNIRRFEATQSEKVARAAQMIVDEYKAGRKTVIAVQGHAPWTFVGKHEDARWGLMHDIDSISAEQNKLYREHAPEGALVLRLGYSGLNPKDAELFALKKQRVILITTPTPLADYLPPPDYLLYMDMGWAFGGATIPIDNYPIKILPSSGIMQVVAYENVNVEVLARLPAVLDPAVPGPTQ